MLTLNGKPVTFAALYSAVGRAGASPKTTTELKLALTRGKGKRKIIRFPGIVEHARHLGVSRIHLYFVLTGERRSPRIEAYMNKQRRAG